MGARLDETETSIGAATYVLGVQVILAVVFPEAHRADLVPAALGKREMPAARAAQTRRVRHDRWSSKPQGKMGLRVEGSLETRSGKAGHNLDEAADVVVQAWQVPRRHPEFLVRAPACTLNRVSGSERILQLETCDEADEAGELVDGVPVLRDLDSVVERQDRVEDRLVRQSRRPRTPTGFGDQLKLAESGRSIQKGIQVGLTYSR